MSDKGKTYRLTKIGDVVYLEWDGDEGYTYQRRFDDLGDDMSGTGDDLFDVLDTLLWGKCEF